MINKNPDEHSHRDFRFEAESYKCEIDFCCNFLTQITSNSKKWKKNQETALILGFEENSK
ncbi:hypothetical protein HQN90_15765 [Paenibacillus alba]|nr:hypothetical protein [Paenibacillus alba]